MKTPVRIEDTFQDATGNLTPNGDTKILIVKDRRAPLPFTRRRPRAGGYFEKYLTNNFLVSQHAPTLVQDLVWMPTPLSLNA